MRNIGSILKNAQRGYQARIAKACGVTPAMISHLRSGRKGLSLQLADKIAQATGHTLIVKNGEFRFQRERAS